jgi:uncharacterized protein with HEPN domain
MRRDYRLFLDDILAAINKIREYTAGLGYSAFIKDSKTQDADCMCILNKRGSVSG